jgi:hypothetical protein
VGALNNRSFSNASSSRESAIKIILYIWTSKTFSRHKSWACS